jgi:hypothetical protein
LSRIQATPLATFEQFEAKYTLPPGWKQAPAWLKKDLSPTSVGTVGPRSSQNWTSVDLFELTPEKYNLFRNWPGQQFVYIRAELDYRDVFADTTNITWCWIAATNERNTEMATYDRAQQLAFPGLPPPAAAR